jgi:phosphatidylglycerophosphate synthase
MLDRSLRRILDPWLESPARLLARYRVPATAITLSGFAVGIAAAVALAWRRYDLALGLILLNRFADGLDGAVARKTAPTDAGGFIDSVCDTIFYASVPLGFAWGDREQFLPALVLLHSFMGTTGSFLVFATFAMKRRLTSNWGAQKSFYYHFGLMEGSETIFFFLAFCLFPPYFGPLAWTFAALCWLTTLVRIVTGVLLFRLPAEDQIESP